MCQYCEELDEFWSNDDYDMVAANYSAVDRDSDTGGLFYWVVDLKLDEYEGFPMCERACASYRTGMIELSYGYLIPEEPIDLFNLDSDVK